jgi:hypothetical protein
MKKRKKITIKAYFANTAKIQRTSNVVPWYTSGVHTCPGNADNLKKRAIKIRVRPTANNKARELARVCHFNHRDATRKSVEPVAAKTQRIPTSNRTEAKAPKL